MWDEIISPFPKLNLCTVEVSERIFNFTPPCMMVNMLLVISITFYFHYNIWGCMYSTGPFQYRWLKGYIYSSCYYHHQIGSIHLSYCYHIFPWSCVWNVYYIIYCYLLYNHSGKIGNLFSLWLCSLWWVQIVRYVLSWRSYSFICTLHHLIIISV